ncbi:hypothetical protein ANO11243_050220 [Dothideomycetidae sp. 11243]|nr:hypothetical protein ANO11243_050220 [fungal sp. No.11243]
MDDVEEDGCGQHGERVQDVLVCLVLRDRALKALCVFAETEDDADLGFVKDYPEDMEQPESRATSLQRQLHLQIAIQLPTADTEHNDEGLLDPNADHVDVQSAEDGCVRLSLLTCHDRPAYLDEEGTAKYKLLFSSYHIRLLLQDIKADKDLAQVPCLDLGKPRPWLEIPYHPSKNHVDICVDPQRGALG